MGDCFIKRGLETNSCVMDLPDEIPANNDEIYGPHSRCFVWKEKPDKGTKTAAECLLSKCVNGKIMIKLKSGRIEFCTRSGQVIDVGLTYDIICPDLSDFCSDWAHRCPMDCHGNGVCMKNNKCFCFEGFSGDDCVIFFFNLGNL